MASDEGLDNTKTGVEIIGEVIKIAANTDEAKQAAKNLGTTAVTITKTINNVLLPLAAVNFAMDKARQYYSDKFPQELGEKTSKIPEENLTEPKPSIAGPALQGLAFTHDEPDLKEMYLNLIANTMDDRKARHVHPAFVEIIKQLTSEEARLGKTILSIDSIGIIQIEQTLDNGRIILQRHVLNAIGERDNAQSELEGLTVIVDNWIRLGLIQVDYDSQLVSEEAYKWVETRPELIRLKEKHKEGTVIPRRGVLTVTALGKQFYKAVV